MRWWTERIGLTNRIGAILATLGVSDYNPLLRNRGRRLAELRTALGEPLPANAHAKLKRLLARLELVLTQIAELERERDAVVETEASDGASKMIQQLTALRGIGVQSATVLDDAWRRTAAEHARSSWSHYAEVLPRFR